MAARVAIRVDASGLIGLGHVKRCLTLAFALRESGLSVAFVSRDLGVDVPSLVGEHGFDCMRLSAPREPAPAPASGIAHAAWAGVDSATDVQQTLAALGDHPVDWIVIDHYAFDAAWHRAARAGTEATIAAIDDLADRPLAADLVIDHNYSPDHRRKYGALLPADALLLGGPQFALIGPTYAACPRYAFSAEVRSIGVFMGGTDPGGYSAMALESISLLGGPVIPVQVATTSANPGLAVLRTAAAADPRFSLVLDQPDLASFFARHDIQIGAGGGALWERFCVGAPTLAIVCADNQLLSVPVLHDLGYLCMAGDRHDWRALTARQLAKSLSSLVHDATLRLALSEKSRSLVDGLGAQRVAQVMVEYRRTRT